MTQAACARSVGSGRVGGMAGDGGAVAACNDYAMTAWMVCWNPPFIA